jgi:hypothetical protein
VTAIIDAPINWTYGQGKRDISAIVSYSAHTFASQGILYCNGLAIATSQLSVLDRRVFHRTSNIATDTIYNVEMPPTTHPASADDKYYMDYEGQRLAERIYTV